jgi:hypothetical protein
MKAQKMAYPKTDDFYRECMAHFTFDYSLNKFMADHHKGDVHWKEPAGCTSPYGVRLTVGPYVLLSHHLVWRMTHGEWPKGYHVKHLDDDVFNNDPANLFAPGRKKKQKNTGTVDFLKSLGVSDRQLHRMQVEQVRAKMGDLEALKLELHYGMIDQDQYEDALEVLESDHRRELRENT